MAFEVRPLAGFLEVESVYGGGDDTFKRKLSESFARMPVRNNRTDVPEKVVYYCLHAGGWLSGDAADGHVDDGQPEKKWCRAGASLMPRLTK